MTPYSSPPIPEDVTSKEGFQDRLHELIVSEIMEKSPRLSGHPYNERKSSINPK